MGMRDTTVLVVDDEPAIRHLLAEVLEDEGHTVITAEDAAMHSTSCTTASRRAPSCWTS
jgi:CheY-like chemotaxis protein